MAKFKLAQDAYIDDRLWKKGDIIEIDPKVHRPGPHMLPVDAELPAMGPVDQLALRTLTTIAVQGPGAAGQ